MKKLLIAFVALLCGGLLIATSSEAARLGGGRSSGIQRSYPPAARPPVRQAPPAAQPQPSQSAPASGLSRWLPMLGGLALGGLLGSMFGGGLGGALGTLLMVALLAIAVVLVLRLLMRPREEPTRTAFSGLAGETAGVPGGMQKDFPQANSVPASSAGLGPVLPPGFDLDGFLRSAKRNFMKLQVANDAGDEATLRDLVTLEMFEELKKDVLARGSRGQTTDVVTVDADLLDLATEGERYYASVRFSGYVREEPNTPPQPFSEVWHLAKATDGSTGWLLAGIQQETA